MTIRAKFRCISETKTAYSSESRQLVFQPMYDPELVAEDVSFAKATPSGELKIFVDNPNANFVLGQDYYLDFTPVPTPASVE
ncbi:hypothetical protein ORI20_13945 [Mycobacterium sp. CVI_P3]|uniref:Uncharacterized protein n=1 Tax=Mycobacterium pinniadriaticum TaxID=2994102 RepID=A0ABT3SE75_9MYCO|nr:hypothetical protein [Mycobacterium pinniadriaticum]MCX2931382.1 hypothetical protein [Mycobacterium pinniadriaticum]MCX2937806.1 hypothetical protein [Mycobacterium pinniadriaticum]